MFGELDSAIDVWGDTGWDELNGAHITFRGRCGHHPLNQFLVLHWSISISAGCIRRDRNVRVFDVLASTTIDLDPYTPALVEL